MTQELLIRIFMVLELHDVESRSEKEEKR